MDLDVIAFGAHPDDVELGCGGTLTKLGAQGSKTGVVALTRGEMGTRGSAEIRAREFAAASGVMGVSMHKMLDMPDAQVEATWENKIKVVREIRAHRPGIVLAPYWVARHPDHEAASRIVREASYLAGLKKLDTGQEAHRPFKVLYYQSRFEFTPSFVVDISAFHDEKLEAIKCYESQFDSPNRADYGTDETRISRPGFITRIETRDRQYGTYVGVEFGEPFLTRETLRIDDPVGFFGPECLESIP